LGEGQESSRRAGRLGKEYAGKRDCFEWWRRIGLKEEKLGRRRSRIRMKEEGGRGDIRFV